MSQPSFQCCMIGQGGSTLHHVHLSFPPKKRQVAKSRSTSTTRSTVAWQHGFRVVGKVEEVTEILVHKAPQLKPKSCCFQVPSLKLTVCILQEAFTKGNYIFETPVIRVQGLVSGTVNFDRSFGKHSRRLGFFGVGLCQPLIMPQKSSKFHQHEQFAVSDLGQFAEVPVAVDRVFQILLLFEGLEKSEIHEWIRKNGISYGTYMEWIMPPLYK